MKEILEMKRRHDRYVKKRLEKLQGITGDSTTNPAAKPRPSLTQIRF